MGLVRRKDLNLMVVGSAPSLGVVIPNAGNSTTWSPEDTKRSIWGRQNKLAPKGPERQIYTAPTHLFTLHQNNYTVAIDVTRVRLLAGADRAGATNLHSTDETRSVFYLHYINTTPPLPSM